MTLSRALAYLDRGWSVFPCAPGAKTPLGRLAPNGVKSASLTGAQVRAWWVAEPRANVAIACGASHLLVLDGDSEAACAWLTAQLGGPPQVRTPRGGGHWYCAMPDGRHGCSRGALPDHVDVRGDGGYVLAPPSTTERGAYTGEVLELYTVPAEVLELMRSPRVTDRSGDSLATAIVAPAAAHGGVEPYARKALEDVDALARVGEGARNNELGRIGKKLGGLVGQKGLTREYLEQQLAGAMRANGWVEDVGEQRMLAEVSRAVAAGISKPRQIPDRKPRELRQPSTWDDATRPAHLRAAPEEEADPEAYAAQLEQDAEHERERWRQSNAAPWVPSSALSPKGELLSTLSALRDVLEAHPQLSRALAWDVRAGRMMARADLPWSLPHAEIPRPWEDADYTYLREHLCRAIGGRWAKDVVIDVCRAVARAHSYDHIRDYLEGLRWDGIERLPTWLEVYLGARPSTYASAVGRLWMVAAVARTLAPGCQVDHLLVLEGPQGCGKSRTLRVLFGQDHIARFPADLSSKDAAHGIQGAWLVEAGEFATLSRQDIAAAKDFISQPVDHYRAPYAREVVTAPRRCVFAATINPSGSGYLRDQTGNRRYWPVELAVTGPVDLEMLARDRDQLWAEACARYRAGEQWWPDDQLTAGVEGEQAARETEDPWQEQLEALLERSAELTINDCCAHLGIERARRGGADATRIGSILRAAGWEREVVRRDSRQCRVWRAKKTTTDDA